MWISNYLICFLQTFFLLHSATADGIQFKVPSKDQEKDQDFWYSLAKDDINFALNRKLKTNIAKNVIIFLGDGMGVTVTTAGRIFKGQQKGNSGEEEFLVWEKFPNAAFSKTYNVDKQVPDSSATATAFFGGVKGNYYTLGVSGAVDKGNCQASLMDDNRVSSILQWSQDAGKDTGLVTTTRVTHATPAALYAHSAHRYWECDAEMNTNEFNTTGCKDIARQLVEDYPGKGIKVILAGGRVQMGAHLPGDSGGCARNDSRNLAREWLEDKKAAGKTAVYVTNNQQLNQLNPWNLDYIMGLFGASHMPYSYERNNGPQGTPTLKKLTEVAIKRLQRSKNGFFLMVEGGRIDHALHDTKPQASLRELLEFEEAVQTALRMTRDDDTLIIVTADHSHVMTMNGYPDRGNDILGTTTYEYVTDGLPYSTLMFTNGYAANFTWDGQKVMRANLTEVDTRDINFMPQAAMPVQFGYETHGGEDVGIFATGPMSHLFHRVHEQSYIAHVMGYAACVGPYKDDCHRVSEALPKAEPATSAPYSGAGRNISLGDVPLFSLLFITVINMLRR